MADPTQTGTPLFTGPQWDMLSKIAGMGAQEQQIAQQRALAGQLRQSGNTRMDRGSQIGRGAAGLGASMTDLAAQINQKRLREQQQRVINQMPGMYGGGSVGSPYGNVDPSDLPG